MTTSAPSTTNQTYLFTVDYSQTLEQMIAAGHYDWTNDKINAQSFSIEGTGAIEFEAVLFHLYKDISFSFQIIKGQIEEVGFEVGKIEHILSFGASYPEEQRKFPIFGLGFVGGVHSERRVLCLDRGGSKRGLNLPRWSNDWPVHSRFLGVRKKVAQARIS
jgi:hypothetical protein